jgi:hypothetical protein
MADTLRDQLERRLTGMKTIRSDYEAEWQDISRFAQPARSRFLSTQKDSGNQRRMRNNRLLDPHGIEAFRTLTNGMTSGLSSASRPWFTLKLGDEETNEMTEVREWLSEVERRMYAFLAKTNFYGAAKAGYSENGLFGTEACVMVDDRELGMVCHSLTAGEYWIAVNDRLQPDALYRNCPMTVRQAVQSFGDKCSQAIRNAYDRGDYQQQANILHAIEPDSDYNPGQFGAKPWRSVYWDADSRQENDGILRVSGFNEKPFWAARWDVVGGDTYGVSPGMESLGALRELQMQAKRRNEAIDGMVKPERIAPASLRLTGEPGRIVTASGVDKDQVFVPYPTPYQAVAAIGEEMDKCRGQIDGLSFADLFNAITNMRGVQPRNVEEIASRNEEKLTQLGPVIERVSNEKLEVAIDRVFGIMLRGGMLPPIPEALEDQELDVEFVSVLQQMQRMVGVGQIERTASFVGNLAGVFPDAVDKLNVDEMIDEYGSRAGAPSRMIRSTKDVEALRAQRAQQQQMAQMAATMPAIQQGADAARLLSETDVGGESLLDRVMPA